MAALPRALGGCVAVRLDPLESMVTWQLITTKNFIPAVACAVVEDRVRQVTRRVKATTPATANYDSLLRDIVDAETSVSAVSKLLASKKILMCPV
jgi:hypothetical protein